MSDEVSVLEQEEEITTDMPGDGNGTVPEGQQEKLTVTLPGDGDEEIQSFHTFLEAHKDVYRVKKLSNQFDTYIRYKRLTERSKEALELTVKRINEGYRTEKQKVADTLAGKKRHHTVTAQNFYNSLSDDALKAHAKTAGLNYYMYDSVDALKEALVKAYVDNVTL